MLLFYLPKYDVSLNDPCCYPLGFMYVSSILKSQGYNVKVLNYNLFDYNLEDELDGVTDIFFTGFDQFVEPIKIAAKLAKDRKITTHLGGAIATYAPKMLDGYIDYFYKGEFCPNLPIDKNPWPDYEGFGIEEYHKRHSVRYMGVLTSRGCPYSCTFCSSICKYRCRSMSAVEQEIDYYINKYKIEKLIVNDNTLNASLGRFKSFSKMMKGKAVEWSAALRLDKLDQSSVQMAKDSGLFSAVVGVESFDQAKLDSMNKQITVEQIENGLNLLTKNNVSYLGNILVSSVKEYEESFKWTSKYTVYPTGIKRYVGNSVTDAPDEVSELCRRYATCKGLDYNV